MSHDGSSLPPSRGSSWGAPLFWLLFFALLLASYQARGQELNVSSDRRTSIEASLIDSLSASAELRQALLAQRGSRMDLEIAYAALKAELTSSGERLQKRIGELTKSLDNSVTLSDDLRAEIRRLTTLLAESKQESEALSKAFEDYRAEMRGQVKGLERSVKTWKVIAGILGATAVGLGFWVALK